MKLGNGANEANLTNSHDYKNTLIQIVEDVDTFFFKKDVEYTFFLEERKHALARAKQQEIVLEARLAKQKAKVSTKRESFKSSLAEVLRISKKLNDSSMSEYIRKTDLI